ncbi:hypothetical protein QA597_09250 [Marinilabiliaceae bacterium ANBcel2]|nr:hypothetical protein [Marinilabiliaceae bacterium ANBcel2]
MVVNKSKYPPVFLLYVDSSGFGAAEVFLKAGIKVVGFTIATRFSYESLSLKRYRLVHLRGDDKSRVLTIIKEAERFKGVKPVLIVNGETVLDLVLDNYSLLKNYLNFEIPKQEIIKFFREKDCFNALAHEYNIKIPLSFEVDKEFWQQKIASLSVKYPLVIKPKYRDDNWIKIFKYQKVIVVNSYDELFYYCNMLLSFIDKIVVQEWIPGTDEDLYFCLAYITKEGEILDSFCGKKVRQYPVLFGTLGSALPFYDRYIEKEALRILRLKGNYGFCSVEFKKCCVTGEYYVIEPTAGRLDRQEHLAYLNGCNILLNAYSYMSGVDLELYKKRRGLKFLKSKKPFMFIEESKEVRSCIELYSYGKFSVKEYYSLLRENKPAFMYMGYSEPFLSLAVILATVKKIIQFMFNSKLRNQYRTGIINHLLDLNCENSSSIVTSKANIKANIDAD